MSDLIIAQVCHGANKAYCQTQGDFSQVDWNEAHEWQKDSAIRGVEFHRDRLDSGLEVKPEASHENWMKQKVAEGWVYGAVKDEKLKTHPCIVPYNELPNLQKIKDVIFCSITKSMHEVYSKIQTGEF